ncbi:MAG: ribosome maturation factor RimM [Eubacteriales bacterium]|nr:ribosome maturation factor RimM [Eubacteriales bacterium]
MEKKALIEAGRIVNTHGVQGEVKIEVWLDSPQFLKSFKRLYLGAEQELRVVSARVHKGFVIAHLDGVDDVNAAMTLKNKTVFIRREDAKLPKGAFFLQDILGARVVDEDGREIGVLEDVLETPASNIYVVKGESEHLIPAVPEFIKKTDADAGVVTVHLIGGM